MKVHVLAVGPSQEMHPIARDEVYRVAYEAIRNAQAHSGARGLWIELEYKRRFHLQIRDNGRGSRKRSYAPASPATLVLPACASARCSWAQS